MGFGNNGKPATTVFNCHICYRFNMKRRETITSFLVTSVFTIFIFGSLLSTPLYVWWLESQRNIPFFVNYLWPLVITCFTIFIFVGGYKLHKFLQSEKSKHEAVLSYILILAVSIGIVASLYASYSGDIVECRQTGGEIHHKSFGMRPFIIQCLDKDGKNMFNMWYEKN
jgi:tellurite resistance protein TehA-like permease